MIENLEKVALESNLKPIATSNLSITGNYINQAIRAAEYDCHACEYSCDDCDSCDCCDL